MLIELMQIKQDLNGNYALSSVFVNPQQIVFISENRAMKQKLQEGKLKVGLNHSFTNFTNIRMNHHSHATELVVVGDPGLIEQKIFNKTQKQLLRG